MAEGKRKAVYNPEANKRWEQKNREHSNYLKSRSAARSFVRSKATLDDLNELQEMINARRAEIKEENE